MSDRFPLFPPRSWRLWRYPILLSRARHDCCCISSISSLPPVCLCVWSPPTNQDGLEAAWCHAASDTAPGSARASGVGAGPPSLVGAAEDPYPSLSDYHDYEPQLEFDDTEVACATNAGAGQKQPRSGELQDSRFVTLVRAFSRVLLVSFTDTFRMLCQPLCRPGTTIISSEYSRRGTIRPPLSKWPWVLKQPRRHRVNSRMVFGLCHKGSRP